MRRRLFTAPSLLSLALCITMCVLWVRSNNPRLTRRDSYWFTVAGCRLYSHEGHICGGGLRITGKINPYGSEAAQLTPEQAKKEIADEVAGQSKKIPAFTDYLIREVEPNRIGFAWDHRRIGVQYSLGYRPVVTMEFDWTAFAIPYWLPVLATGVLPAFMFLRRWRTRRRSRAGCCVICGYDTRATPGRCPECGTAAKA